MKIKYLYMHSNYDYYITRCLIFLIINIFLGNEGIKAQDKKSPESIYLEELLELLEPDLKHAGKVNNKDASWRMWQKRTGELPPDFSKLPDIPGLPDPLIIDEGGTNIPVTTPAQWEEKKTWIREQLQHWVTGTFPPAPALGRATILNEKLEADGVKIQMIELSFGPENKGKMTVELIIPPSEKSRGVFMTQWNHRGWGLVAVRRGYIACVYAGSDSKDDSEAYAELYPDYDFTRLARRAWGASRVVDYLQTLPFVDKDKIAIAGHSRNGKQAMIAGAFDERIKAVIASTGSIAGGLPYRFTDDKFDSESIDDVSRNFPTWIHPRARFFMGREHKLPIDQNLMGALIAPRGFCFTAGYIESTSNHVGMELMYASIKKVYNLLDSSSVNKLYYRARNGLHNTSARDIEAFVDYLDRLFYKKEIPHNTYHYNNYDFDRWKAVSGVEVSLDTLPVHKESRLKKIKKPNDWPKHHATIRSNIHWLLGETPPGSVNPGPLSLGNTRNAQDWVASLIKSDNIENEYTGNMLVCPYNSFGDYLYGNLYYPKLKNGSPDTLKEKLPLVIFHHTNSTATGFRKNISTFIHQLTANGVAVFAYDMLGFGSRVEEATSFYERYPKWSKMGKMVTDVEAAVDALSNLSIIDTTNVYLAGYNIGSSVALIGTALDDRIRGVAAYSGFSPWRNTDSQTAAMREHSHFFGTIPKLGFFLNEPEKVPVDWDEIIASISPRNVMLYVPTLDRHTSIKDFETSVPAIQKTYRLTGGAEHLALHKPIDFNRWTPERQKDFAMKILDMISY